MFPLAMANPAVAGQPSTIELTDGSAIVGEILTIEHGPLTVHADRLGVLSPRDGDIVTIRPWNPVLPSSSSSTANPELAAIQQRIIATPGLLAAIEALQSDPEIQRILKRSGVPKGARCG